MFIRPLALEQLIFCILETLANSEDPDKMQHDAAFHRGLHCLLRLKQPLETEVLSCQPRVTVTSCFVYKVITDLESIDYLCINPIRRIGLIHK